MSNGRTTDLKSPSSMPMRSRFFFTALKSPVAEKKIDYTLTIKYVLVLAHFNKNLSHGHNGIQKLVEKLAHASCHFNFTKKWKDERGLSIDIEHTYRHFNSTNTMHP